VKFPKLPLIRRSKLLDAQDIVTEQSKKIIDQNKKIIEREEYIKKASRVIEKLAHEIADLKIGHKNFQETIDNAYAYVESFNQEVKERNALLEQRHAELRILRRRIGLIEGLIMSLDEMAKTSRLAGKIKEILDAEITINPEKPTTLVDPISDKT
jgi:predicted RNase H-like nuclease (RuvC/YqgF family)